jgi:PAS domain S-box-containing protein
MMKGASTSLAHFLEAALRGAAKIVGCESSNLFLYNEKTREIRVHLGIAAHALPVLAEIEKLMGTRFSNLSCSMERAEDSLVSRCWREAVYCETTSLKELIGGAIPSLVRIAIEPLVGLRQFACVPALSATRSYGVLLFEKRGTHPFNRQQREVLVRYARRIGEILENDLLGQSQTLFDSLSDGQPDSLLIDAQGQVRGHGRDGGALVDRVLRDGDLRRKIIDRARAFLADAYDPREGTFEPAGLRIQFSRLELDGSPLALCTLSSCQPSAPSLESQLVRLTLTAPAPALFVDPEFRITSCNPAISQYLGYPAAQLTDKPLGVLFTLHDEIMDILGQQAVDPQKPYTERTTVVRRQDGSLVPTRVEALMLANDAHEMVGFLLVLRTPAKPDADHVLQQERLATMGEMAAQLAHEIRNPLVAIGATIESLLRDGETPESQRGLLAAVSKEIVRMDTTLKDYLAARRELSVARVPVADLLDGTCRVLAEAHRTSGKTIRCQVPPDLTIEADYEAIKQVVFNLLLNALEATPAGGEVLCSATRNGFEVAITVEDRGHGLRASAAECLRPFFTTKKNGTGLGLAVCQKIARAHGGFIDLRNRAGGGCQATVVLPCKHPLREGTS